MNDILNDQRKYILENLMIDFFDDEESLFLSGKIDPNFLLYLLLEIENKYGIVFDDADLQLEYFDSIKLITEIIKKKLSQ
jgi:acyl carrier protein